MKLWIARDADGSLALYEREPLLVVGRVWSGGCALWVPKEEYSSVTFENSPQQVEIKLIENEESSNE